MQRARRSLSVGYHAPVSIPNIERAVVEPAKIRDDLLSATHPVDRFKAAFFRALGYDAARPRFVTAYPGDP